MKIMKMMMTTTTMSMSMIMTDCHGNGDGNGNDNGNAYGSGNEDHNVDDDSDNYNNDNKHSLLIVIYQTKGLFIIVTITTFQQNSGNCLHPSLSLPRPSFVGLTTNSVDTQKYMHVKLCIFYKYWVLCIVHWCIIYAIFTCHLLTITIYFM